MGPQGPNEPASVNLTFQRVTLTGLIAVTFRRQLLRGSETMWTRTSTDTERFSWRAPDSTHC